MQQQAPGRDGVHAGELNGVPEYKWVGSQAAKPLLHELTAVDLERGVSLYAMVDNWRGWVNRRVERVELLDAVASRRYISLDCTLRERYALRVADGTQHFYVPLSLHEKRRVTSFSVRDENGRALPILTQARSAYLGTTTLGVAALTVWAQVTKRTWHAGVIAPDVLADLDYIATQDWRSALARLRVFAEVPSPERDYRERELRELGGKPITSNEARQALVPLTDETLDLSRRWRQILTKPEVANTSSGSPDPALAFGDLAHDFARNFLIVALVSEVGSTKARAATQPALAEHVGNVTGREHHRLLKFSFEEQHRVPSPYVLSGLRRAVAPLGLVSVCTEALRRAWWRVVSTVCLPPRMKRMVRAGHWRTVRTMDRARTLVRDAHNPRAVLQRAWATVGRYGRCGVVLIRKGERAIAVRPKIFSVPTPSIGRCDCYHLEVEAPDGLQITGAELRPRSERSGFSAEVDRVSRSVQRVHLHLAGVHQAASGEALIMVRPRTWNDLLPACVAAAITVTLLVWVGASWDGLGKSKSQAAGLLLALPAALGFFVSRRSESGLVTSVLRGVRTLAFLTGAWALMGVAVVLADDPCDRQGKGWLWEDHTKLECGPDYLWVLAVLALLTLLPLGVATIRAWDPPLRRDIDDDGDDFDSSLRPTRQAGAGSE